MYEYINGPVAELTPTYAVLDAAGVGYYLNISLETYAALEGAQQAKLFVHYVVREDAQVLYGFATRAERELFRLLIGVSGVGGNTARTILSTYSPADLQNIITTGNAVLLKNVKGLGLKTAQKIIVELSGKLTGLEPGESLRADRRSAGGADDAGIQQIGGRKSPAHRSAHRTRSHDRRTGPAGAERIVASQKDGTTPCAAPGPRLWSDHPSRARERRGLRLLRMTKRLRLTYSLLGPIVGFFRGNVEIG